MNSITNLIRLTHPTALKEAIEAAHDGTPDDAEETYSYLFGALLNDDTFNEYSDTELIAAIDEIINED